MTSYAPSPYCDICKRVPEPFNIMDSEDKGYFFIVPVEDQDPAHLMDDLTFTFKVCTEKEHELFDGNEYWCSDCLEASGKTEETFGESVP